MSDDDWIVPPPQPPLRLKPRGKAEVLLWTDQLELLKKHDFPGSAKLLKTAKAIDTDDGNVLLRGSIKDVEWLAGFVASEANHHARTHPRSRLAALWADISERLECAL